MSHVSSYVVRSIVISPSRSIPRLEGGFVVDADNFRARISPDAAFALRVERLLPRRASGRGRISVTPLAIATFENMSMSTSRAESVPHRCHSTDGWIEGAVIGPHADSGV